MFHLIIIFLCIIQTTTNTMENSQKDKRVSIKFSPKKLFKTKSAEDLAPKIESDSKNDNSLISSVKSASDLRSVQNPTIDLKQTKNSLLKTSNEKENITDPNRINQQDTTFLSSEKRPSKNFLKRKSLESTTHSKTQSPRDIVRQINTALFTAVQENNDGDVRGILNPNLNQIDNNQNSLLNIAIINGNEKIVKILLEQKNIEVNSTNKDGNTPLHNATIQNFVSIIDLLLKHPGVDSTKKNYQNCLAHQYITKTKGSLPLENSLKARTLIDDLINKEALAHSFSPVISENIIKGIFGNVLKQINVMIKNEEIDKPLLDTITNFYLPNDFIKDMIMARLKKPQNLNILK